MKFPAQTQPKPIKAPDPILTELWEVKRQLNEAAGFCVADRARMAHEAALQIEAGWHDSNNRHYLTYPNEKELS
ncbi:hypothetical protein SAMN05421644_1386 [Allochromatium warmingii]|uniref:Uncharacterized protein n=1 Tax=Allochromatium warmingii TaxID=61595 RepID=A0A1H3I0I2_ALLWA|nr:hypothetical protein [Allochromatium warmingii]SDY20554.1 hypothetical protein SAMN05421644_1386 [Allochromatium warmingii]